MRGIIAHELAHLKTNDLWWLHVIRLCQTALWFHPLAWNIGRAHESACENVCDNVAAACVGDVRAYSSTLAMMALSTVSENKLMYGGISMVGKAQIIRRLEALKGKIKALPLSRTQVSAFLTLAVLSLTVVSTVDLISDRGLLQAAPAEDEWLSVAEVMPRFKNSPPKAKMPEEITKKLAEADTTVTSVIVFYIDEQGKVDKELTKIKSSSGYKELDKIALDWAVKLEFNPALDRGKPVKVKIRVPVVWKAK
jgi:TonB family protein